jgi:hypothetical protein
MAKCDAFSQLIVYPIYQSFPRFSQALLPRFSKEQEFSDLALRITQLLLAIPGTVRVLFSGYHKVINGYRCNNTFQRIPLRT